MKRLFFLIFTIIGLYGVSNTPTPEELMQKAQKLYSQEHYSDAANTYAKILSQGYESPEIYYNIGNCYFKNNQITNAIYFYEKALKLAPNDKDILYNLSLANQYTVDKIKHLSPFWLTSLFTHFFALNNSDGWAVISTSSFIAFLVIVLLFLFIHHLSLKRLFLWIAILLLGISLVSLWGAMHQYHEEEAHETAIIFAPTSNVKSSPAENGTNLMIIHEGLKVSVKDSVNSWYKITLPDGNEGWIEKSSLKRI